MSDVISGNDDDTGKGIPKVNPRYADAAYEVGKGKPPVANQFKLGCKPGPGRRKKSSNKTDFDKVFDEMIVVGHDNRGRPIRKSARTIANMQLRKLVLECNLQAIKFMKMHELRITLARLAYLSPPPGL